MKNKNMTLNRCLFQFLLLVFGLFLMAVPVKAGYTIRYTMNVGETISVSASTSKGTAYSYGWYSNNASAVQVTGGTTRPSTTIKAVGYFSQTVIVRCNIYYRIARGKFTYTGSDYVDYEITINKPKPTTTPTLRPTATPTPRPTATPTPRPTSTPKPTPTPSPKPTPVTQTYTLTFRPNGGAGNAVTENHVANQTFALRGNPFTRAGYDFAGWNGRADGSGISFTVGQKIRLKGNAVLYAQWRKQAAPTPTPKPTATPTPVPANSSSVKIGTRLTYAGVVYTVTSSNTLECSFLLNTSLTEVSIPSALKYKNNIYYINTIADFAFFDARFLKTVTIGKNVTRIGDCAFSDCSNLKTVNMGSNVTTIGFGAFFECTALESIEIPSKVTAIGASAFFRNTAIKAFYIKTSKLTSSSVGSNAFSGVPSSVTMYVPAAKLSAYKTLVVNKGANKNTKVVGYY